jgi:hypothetical protein
VLLVQTISGLPGVFSAIGPYVLQLVMFKRLGGVCRMTGSITEDYDHYESCPAYQDFNNYKICECWQREVVELEVQMKDLGSPNEDWWHPNNKDKREFRRKADVFAQDVFNDYRSRGYKARDIYTALLDVLSTSANLHRELDRYGDMPDEAS